jgi:polyvinyl alcohol dehydrogenase (cytochrome)
MAEACRPSLSSGFDAAGIVPSPAHELRAASAAAQDAEPRLDVGRHVVEGGLDGMLRAFDAKTGEVLFEFDTARTFEALNGVEAKGGSIDSASITAANGYLFVNSGYGMFGQMAGNVLLAFKAKNAEP